MKIFRVGIGEIPSPELGSSPGIGGISRQVHRLMGFQAQGLVDFPNEILVGFLLRDWWVLLLTDWWKFFPPTPFSLHLDHGLG